MNAQFESLLHEYNFLDNYQTPELILHQFSEDDVRIFLVGIAAKINDHLTITASAADTSEYPMQRAFFELLERIAIYEAEKNPARVYQLYNKNQNSIGEISGEKVFPKSCCPQEWQYSKSNGVAAGRNFGAACVSAQLELIERDFVLRSWYGKEQPKKIDNPMYFNSSFFEKNYEIETYLFSRRDIDGEGVGAVGIFGFPKSDLVPFVNGFGAANDQAVSRLKATKEIQQRIGFLWGESIPEVDPVLHPSAYFHQEYYLVPKNLGRIHHWLSGGNKCCSLTMDSSLSKDIYFVNLTPDFLKEKITVVKAISGDFLPLIFGKGHPWVKNMTTELAIHPIA